jgi:hypothetical protein
MKRKSEGAIKHEQTRERGNVDIGQRAQNEDQTKSTSKKNTNKYVTSQL